MSLKDPIKPSDYVLATKWSDGDPGDQWCIGLFKGRLQKSSGDRFLVSDFEGKEFRANGFRRIAKISKARGEFILRHMVLIEAGCRSLWWWKRVSMKKFEREMNKCMEKNNE